MKITRTISELFSRPSFPTFKHQTADRSCFEPVKPGNRVTSCAQRNPAHTYSEVSTPPEGESGNEERKSRLFCFGNNAAGSMFSAKRIGDATNAGGAVVGRHCCSVGHPVVRRKKKRYFVSAFRPGA